MRYEELKATWDQALVDAGLPPRHAEEKLDLGDMSRMYEAIVEPVGGQDGPPFFVTAKLSVRWDAIHTTRAATNEHDFLTQIVGGGRAPKLRTERPWLRADIVLRATLPYGKPIAMPAPRVWAKWVEEAMVRLEEIERLAPDDLVREKKDGRHEILAWSAEQRPSRPCAASTDAAHHRRRACRVGGRPAPARPGRRPPSRPTPG